MKKNCSEGLSRLTALLLILAFLLSGCPTPTNSPVSASPDGESPVPSAPTAPSTPSNPPPVSVPPTITSLVPIPQILHPEASFFYLNRNAVPTSVDTGRTGFIIRNMEETRGLVIVSEYTGVKPITRVFGIAGIDRIDFEYPVAGSLQFPERIVIVREGVTDIVAELSPYDDARETFSVELHDAEFAETYDDLVLNKSVFTAYPGDHTLNASQNLRVRNIITAVALWTSLAIQTDALSAAQGVERNENGAYIVVAGGAKQVFQTIATVFAVVAVIAVAAVVIMCPPIALVVPSIISNVTVIPLAAIISIAVGAIPTGVALAALFISGTASAIAQGMDQPPEAAPTQNGTPLEEQPGETPPVVEPPPVLPHVGDPGPAGGVLFQIPVYGVGEVYLYSEWYEAAPQNFPITYQIQTEDGSVTAEAACANYVLSGKDDWFLPNTLQLYTLYRTLFVDGLLEGCRPNVQYWSSDRDPDNANKNVTVDFYFNGEATGISPFAFCHVIPIRRVSDDELEAL
ncbi:MAG: hypothetical protein LBS86_04515 [Treponema sp.]|jgi:hypothetical protein|nr:hypothetical protein [Treponema sp.]